MIHNEEEIETRLRGNLVEGEKAEKMVKVVNVAGKLHLAYIQMKQGCPCMQRLLLMSSPSWDTCSPREEGGRLNSYHAAQRQPPASTELCHERKELSNWICLTIFG